MNLSVGTDVPYKLPEQDGVQTTLLFHQLLSGPDPSETNQQSPSCHVFSSLHFHTVLCMNVNGGMSESKPCTV